METIINLKIEKIEENGLVYFLATSDDVQGLLAQGSTVEEVIEIASDVARIMFEIDKEWNNPPTFKALPTTFQYPLIVKV